jgi:hypothetical protein
MPQAALRQVFKDIKEINFKVTNKMVAYFYNHRIIRIDFSQFIQCFLSSFRVAFFPESDSQVLQRKLMIRVFLERGLILGDGALDIRRLAQIKSQSEIGSDVYIVRVFGERGDVIFLRRFVFISSTLSIFKCWNFMDFPVFSRFCK